MGINWVRLVLGASAVLAIGAAGGLIGSSALAARAYQDRAVQDQKRRQELSVTGSARQRIKSDLGVWRVRAYGRGRDLKTAYQNLKETCDRVQKFLDTRQFKQAEIALSAVDTTTHYMKDKDGRETREVAEYSLDREFTVTSAQLPTVTSAAAEVTELLQEGLHVVSMAPAYYYTRMAELKMEALGEASKNARLRAELIACNSGCRVGEVRQASVGVLQITRPHSTDVSSSGIYDTTTVGKDVNAVVHLTFTIQSP